MSHRDDLARALGITADDLDANRAGALGPRQRRQLVASGWRSVGAALLAGAALAAILLWVANKPLNAAQVTTASLLFLAALAAGLFDLRRTRGAAADGRVECTAGPVAVVSRGSNGWFLEVAGRAFRMPVRPWHVRNGAAYRVYVSARGNRVVGMEPDGWD